MCAEARFIRPLCLNSLGGPLRARGRGGARRETPTMQESDFLVVMQEHEFPPAFVSFVFHGEVQGAAGRPPFAMGASVAGNMKNSDCGIRG